LMPADLSDPVDNAKAIIGELEKYSPKLAQKPRWIVFNKIDLMLEEEAEELCQKILTELNWQGESYAISAFQRQNTDELCSKVMDYIETLPSELDDLIQDPEDISFTWDSYHKQILDENQVDDFDDDDLDDDEDGDDDFEVVYTKQ
jgi:GTP-binding protein